MIFRNFKTIRTFGEDIYEVGITIEEADEDQSNLADKIKNFSDKTRPKSLEKNKTKKILLLVCIIFSKQEKWFLMVLKVKYF